MKLFRISLTGLALCAGGVLAARAEISATAEQDLQFFMNEVPTVTIAAKKEESLLAASGTAYVVTEDDIRRYGWRNMQEALASIPNIDYKNDYNWLAGGQRGFNGNFSGTLLLLDGREIQNLIANEAFMTTGVSLQRVKRIEVLQGPNSTLYGANAMQGVINIITKAADGQPDDQEVRVLAGGGGTQEYSAVLRKNEASGLSFGFDASAFKTDRNWGKLAGFAMNDELYSRGSNVTSDSAVSKDALRDHDPGNFYLGEKDSTYDLHMQYKGFHAGVDYWQVENAEGLEGVNFNRRTPLTTRGYSHYYAGADHKFNDRLKASAEFRYLVNDEVWNNVDPTAASIGLATGTAGSGYGALVFQQSLTRSYNERREAAGQADYALNDWNHFIAGADFRFMHSRVDNIQPSTVRILPADQPAVSGEDSTLFLTRHGKPVERSYFVQDAMDVLRNRFKITAGLMYHTQTFVRNVWLPRGSVVFQPRPTSAVKLTYGKGFRVPANYELDSLFSADPSLVTGDLPSQEMEMYELNYSQALSVGDEGQLMNVAAVYTMKASNIINTGASAKVGGTFLPRQVVSGAEDSLNYKVSELRGFLGMRLVNPARKAVGGMLVDPDQPPVGARRIKADVPLAKFKAGLSYDVMKHLSTGAFVDHWSKVRTEANVAGSPTYADANGDVHVFTEAHVVPAWTAVNLNLLVRDIGSGGVKAEVSFYVENLFNATYYHANHRDVSPIQYLQPPRNFRLTLTMRV